MEEEIKQPETKPKTFVNEYSTKEFWNARFKTFSQTIPPFTTLFSQKGYFDWYLEYEDLQVYFEKKFPIRKSDKILIVGCGNSSKPSYLPLIH